MKNIYIHLKTNGEVFYVGCGNNVRPYIKNGRNKDWLEYITNNPYEIQILKRNLSLEDAYELEEILIDYYGRKCDCGTLFNKSKGGKVTKGFSSWSKGKHLSAEHRNKIASAQQGDKHRMYGKPALNRKKLICIETGKIFNSLTEAAKEINLSLAYLSQMLNGVRPNTTTLKYLNE